MLIQHLLIRHSDLKKSTTNVFPLYNYHLPPSWPSIFSLGLSELVLQDKSFSSGKFSSKTEVFVDLWTNGRGPSCTHTPNKATVSLIGCDIFTVGYGYCTPLSIDYIILIHPNQFLLQSHPSFTYILPEISTSACTTFAAMAPRALPWISALLAGLVPAMGMVIGQDWKFPSWGRFTHCFLASSTGS